MKAFFTRNQKRRFLGILILCSTIGQVSAVPSTFPSVIVYGGLLAIGAMLYVKGQER